MTSAKHLLTLLLITSFVFSCEEEPSQKKGRLEFSFEDVGTLSGGRIKTDAPSAVLVTLQNSTGAVIHERKKITLYKFDDNYISEPIALTTGKFSLTEFIVVNDAQAAVFAAPVEGSPLDHLTDDPLPMELTVNKDQVVKVTPQVVRVEGHTAADFGYTTFGFEVVETLAFNVGVLAYSSSTRNFELTSSHIRITASGDVQYDNDLTAITHTISVKRGFSAYTVIVTKSGYLPYEQTFTAEALEGFDTGTPLVVALMQESLTEGLIAHYPFDGNANDQTANKFHGVVHGAVLTTDRDGHPSSAYRFDGVDDHIRIPHHEVLNPEDFTISLWANIAVSQEPNNGINDIIRKWDGDAQGYPFGISYLNTLADDAVEDRVLFARYDGQVCGNTLESHSPLITNDTFVHIVLIKQGDKIRTYLDNVLVEEVLDPATCNVGNDADITIGSRGNLARYFKGTIDDVRIYDRPLTDVEIANLFGE